MGTLKGNILLSNCIFFTEHLIDFTKSLNERTGNKYAENIADLQRLNRKLKQEQINNPNLTNRKE